MANFTPAFKGYSGQQPFRFWCQTALPSVYDDSLSYYELLNKVVNSLNKVISDTTNMEDNVNALLTAYNELQSYVNNYFDNLDVQSEIDNKLDKMVTDGTLDDIINNKIFNEMRTAIVNNSTAIANLGDTKIGFDDTNYVGMSQLTQDVKEAMTGGSTAVVGTNSVNTVNIVNGAVTKDKIKNSVKTVILNAYPNAKITVYTEPHSIVFSYPFMIIAGGASININPHSSPSIVYYSVSNTTKWIVYTPSTTFITIKETRDDDDYVLGSVFADNISFVGNANVTYIPEQLPQLTDLIPTMNSEVYLNSRIIFNLNDSVITFDRTANMYLSIGNYYNIINTTNVNGSNYQNDIDISEQASGIQNVGVLCFDTSTQLFTAMPSNAMLAVNYIPIAFFSIGFNFVHCTLPYSTICSQVNLYDTEDEIAVFGDSITAGASSNKPFVKAVNQLKGYRLLNYGVGSTSYTVNLTEGTTHLTGNGTPEQGTNQTVGSLNTITERVKAYLQTSESQSTKIIFLFGGYNDFHFQRIMPSTDDPPTDTGKLQYFTDKVDEAIEACLNNGKMIGLVAPLRSYEDEDTYSIPLKSFVDILKERAEHYGIPFLNLYECGLDPNNTSIRNLYFADGVHPNNKGSAKLGIMFTNFIEQWFCCKHTN